MTKLPVERGEIEGQLLAFDIKLQHTPVFATHFPSRVAQAVGLGVSARRSSPKSVASGFGRMPLASKALSSTSVVATGQAHALTSYDREAHALIRNMSRASLMRCSCYACRCTRLCKFCC